MRGALEPMVCYAQEVERGTEGWQDGGVVWSVDDCGLDGQTCRESRRRSPRQTGSFHAGNGTPGAGLNAARNLATRLFLGLAVACPGCLFAQAQIARA